MKYFYFVYLVFHLNYCHFSSALHNYRAIYQLNASFDCGFVRTSISDTCENYVVITRMLKIDNYNSGCVFSEAREEKW